MNGGEGLAWLGCPRFLAAVLPLRPSGVRTWHADTRSTAAAMHGGASCSGQQPPASRAAIRCS